MRNLKQLIKRAVPAVLMLLAFSLQLQAQGGGGITVKGTVVDNNAEPLIGASVVVKGNTSLGTVTDFDGNFVLKVPSESTTLVVSYVGMTSREVRVGKERNIKITLMDDTQLEEVIVVGYGQQKKASVVGAITQTTGETLQRAAGITDIGSALTGNLPGVVTTASSGIPGEEDPQIIIRGQSSWNNSSPLVLVDGIERPMSSVDIQSVATISVLKDASATAVYGVKGANGVILITTKRGSEGKAQIGVSANVIMKIPSMLPDKYDSYDAMVARNKAIEHELNIAPDAFAYMKPMSFIENYRNQTTVEQRERYPNVDWQRTMFKKSTMSYNANLNISGGTKFVKYFASVDFVSEGDLFKSFPTGRHYDRSISYNRVNVRSNLDFNITKTTVLKVNIAGSNGKQTNPWERGHEWDNGSSLGWQMSQMWAGVYNISPDAFLPQYSDGSWGFLPGSTNVSNSAQVSSIGGVQTITTTRINTDFVLEQKLDFITKGLSFRGLIAWDNVFREDRRGIADLYNDPQLKWIDPETGIAQYKQPYEGYDRFDYTMGNKWTTQGGEVNNNETQRNLNYQLQLNWGRQFGLHDVTAMVNFGRQEYAKGSMIPSYREDWVFRATYNYAGKYSFEYNGAYNGSEKFSKDNRFAFFQSGAIGWTISEEPFMKYLREKHIIDMLKFRASYGEIGDDNIPFARFLYMTQWAYGGNTSLDVTQGASPYQFYREATVGNPDVHWEKVKKFNFGIDFGFLGGLVAGSFDIFHDKRVDILVAGSRQVPSYFGQAAALVNQGEVKTHGYELEVRFNKVFANKMRLWANMSMTHAVNEVIMRDDPALYPSYRKAEGYAIGQQHAHISKHMTQNYDDIYGTPKHDSSDGQKLPGDYYIVDFNGDGVVDANDNVPYGYSGSPQNTYNATIGFEYKGFSCFAQFYGVTNVTRDVTMISLSDRMQANVYDQGTWWSDNHTGAKVLTPRFISQPSYYYGTQYLCDGSYIRLKNVEVAYTFNQPWVRKLGIRDLKVFVSGNNLWLWTRMPDDRESNFSSNGGATGAYPTVKRINFGVKFNL